MWLAKGYGTFQSAWRTIEGIENGPHDPERQSEMGGKRRCGRPSSLHRRIVRPLCLTQIQPFTNLHLPQLLYPKLRYETRFDNPWLPTLPWFARFIVLSAVDRVLNPAGEAPKQDLVRALTVGYLLHDFLASLPINERAAILKQAERWPSALTMLFHYPARPRRRFSRAPKLKYNTAFRF